MNNKYIYRYVKQSQIEKPIPNKQKRIKIKICIYTYTR